MAGGNGVELQQRNTNNPYEPARGGIEELIKQATGTFNANQGMGPSVSTGPAYQQLQGQYSGLRSTIPQNYSGILGRFGGTSSTESNLSDVAAGKQVGNNPYFNQMLDQRVDQALNAARSENAGLGRAGSNWSRDRIADTAAGITVPAMAQQYNADLGRMDSANQAIDAARLGYGGMQRGILSDTYNTHLAALGGQQTALGGQTAVEQANIANTDPWRNNEAFARILGSLSPYGTQETFEPPPSPLQMIMGILGGVGGLAGGLLGDQPGQGGMTTGQQSMQPRQRREGILGGY